MLIVGGHAETLDVLKQSSVELGVEVILAPDSRSAMRLWRDARPAVVTVAKMHGGAAALQRLARRIRAQEQAMASMSTSMLTRCVLLAADGYADLRQYDLYRAAGFDAVLTLPLRPGALRSRLAACGLTTDARTREALEARAEAEAMFQREIIEDLQRLHRAIEARSASDIARCAHRIKGASLMFGKTAMGDAAALLEGVDGQGPPTDIERLRQLARELEALNQSGLSTSP